MDRIRVIFKREFAGYFSTPIAAVFIVIFLMLSGAFTFYLGNYFVRGQADLAPFFEFHPWLYRADPGLGHALVGRRTAFWHYRTLADIARDDVGSRRRKIFSSMVFHRRGAGVDLPHVDYRQYLGRA